LQELRNAATEFNNDGIPIAIEGLRALAMYIEVGADDTDAQAAAIALRTP
jgi:hypothetical protein